MTELAIRHPRHVNVDFCEVELEGRRCPNVAVHRTRACLEHATPVSRMQRTPSTPAVAPEPGPEPVTPQPTPPARRPRETRDDLIARALNNLRRRHREETGEH